MVYAPRCVDLRSIKNRKTFHVPWAEKRATAVFRGNSTGGGVSPETNQRLHLAKLSQDWATDERYNDSNPIDGQRFLDAGVVAWNIRDKKLQGEPMKFLHKDVRAFRFVCSSCCWCWPRSSHTSRCTAYCFWLVSFSR